MEYITYTSLYLGGEWVRPATTTRLEVRSASTDEPLGSVPDAVEADIDAAVLAARRAFDDPDGWRYWSAARRATALERFATALEARGAETAYRVSAQNGMPISVSSHFEATVPATLLRYYGSLVVESDTEEVRPGLFGGQSLILKDPIGVVAAIVPWNVPQAITFLKIAPALAAGCTVIVKPAPETVLDAFLMAEAAAEADLPPGVLNIVPGGREVGSHLVSHSLVDKVSFTGSTAAGRAIAETCGRLLRPVTLELGGKSAAVILDDAVLDEKLPSLFDATLLNNGQVCWLGTRVLAPRSRYAEIVDAITDLARSAVVGDPLDHSTQTGPLVSSRQRDRVEHYIRTGMDQGARLTTGGRRPPGLDTGWFVEPTVFADVHNSCTIAREEIFGPVLAVIPYTDDEEAVKIANDSEYGLGGSVWTSDAQRGQQIAREIYTGAVGINGFANDPSAPFGGVKASGIGRELGPEGLQAFQVVKTIYSEAS